MSDEQKVTLLVCKNSSDFINQSLLNRCAFSRSTRCQHNAYFKLGIYQEMYRWKNTFFCWAIWADRVGMNDWLRLTTHACDQFKTVAHNGDGD